MGIEARTPMVDARIDSHFEIPLFVAGGSGSLYSLQFVELVGGVAIGKESLRFLRQRRSSNIVHGMAGLRGHWRRCQCL